MDAHFDKLNTSNPPQANPGPNKMVVTIGIIQEAK
jgi:hypothetical protein